MWLDKILIGTGVVIIGLNLTAFLIKKTIVDN